MSRRRAGTETFQGGSRNEEERGGFAWMNSFYHVVRAVQTLRAPLRGVLGESRYARVWTAVRDVIPETRAIPPQRISRTRT